MAKINSTNIIIKGIINKLNKLGLSNKSFIKEVVMDGLLGKKSMQIAYWVLRKWWLTCVFFHLNIKSTIKTEKVYITSVKKTFIAVLSDLVTYPNTSWISKNISSSFQFTKLLEKQQEWKGVFWWSIYFRLKNL